MLSLLLLCDLDTRACHTATTTTSAPPLPPPPRKLPNVAAHISCPSTDDTCTTANTTTQVTQPQ
eukprot:COSAG06_NODE_43237_length_374_cov_0.523636_1_plen_63_part_01